MNSGIDSLFATHGRALQVHARRIEVIASNLANADTPGFKARDLDFQQLLADSLQSERMRATHEWHIGGGQLPLAQAELLYRRPLQPSLDGNTVDSNMEKTALAEASVRYESSLTFLTRKLSGLKAALRID
jgi:flagellar basal-body rod protein FlgB